MIENSLIGMNGVRDVVITNDIVECVYNVTLCTPRDIRTILQKLGFSAQLKTKGAVVDHNYEIRQ